MIITTRFPDLPPQPETRANAGFRRRFFSRWGRENSVFVAAARSVEYGPLPTALSVKTVLDGEAVLTLGRRRRVRLEPGRYLVVNAGDEYSVTIRSERPVRCLSVHFDPALAEEVAAAQGLDWAGALEGPRRKRAPQLSEALRPHDPALGPLLARLQARVEGGEAEPAAFEADVVAALEAMLRVECRYRTKTLGALSAARPATRAELARRVGWATDFIHSWHAEPITLDEIAAAASLSKYHLIRAFQQVHGCTPYRFVLGRRAEAAQRLLADRSLDLDTVAARCGFGSRWTLARALRQHFGASGTRLRAAARDEGATV